MKNFLILDDYNGVILQSNHISPTIRQTCSAIALRNGIKIIELYDMKGMMYKDEFWPLYWGGVLFNSPSFGVKPKDNISPTLRSEKTDVGICVEYEYQPKDSGED